MTWYVQVQQIGLETKQYKCLAVADEKQEMLETMWKLKHAKLTY